MLGCFRLFLAVLVAVSHLMGNYQIAMPGINFGASAVVCFYFISGYLMYLSFERFREHARHPVRGFYVDRLMRLCPSYFMAYAAASLWLYFAFGLNIFAGREWLAEVLIIPANYTLLALPLPLAAAANPPTWSLGAELQFYLLLPAVMLLGRRLRVVLLIVLLAGQVALMAVSGKIINYAPWCQMISPYFCYFPVSDLLVYRWLPLAMAPFVLGMILAEHGGKSWFPWPLAATVAAYGGIWIASETGLGFQNHMVPEVVSATVLLVPAAYVVLKKFSRRSAWDRALGNLAYPLFLDHILCISMTNSTSLTGWRAALVFLLLAITISSAIAALQAGFDRLRYRQRGFGALARSRTFHMTEEAPVYVKA